MLGLAPCSQCDEFCDHPNYGTNTSVFGGLLVERLFASGLLPDREQTCSSSAARHTSRSRGACALVRLAILFGRPARAWTSLTDWVFSGSFRKAHDFRSSREMRLAGATTMTLRQRAADFCSVAQHCACRCLTAQETRQGASSACTANGSSADSGLHSQGASKPKWHLTGGAFPWLGGRRASPFPRTMDLHLGFETLT